MACAHLRVCTAPSGVHCDAFISFHLLCRFSFHFSSFFFCASLLILFDGAGQWKFPAPSREGVWGGMGRDGKRGGGGAPSWGGERRLEGTSASVYLGGAWRVRGKELRHGGYRRCEGLVTCSHPVGLGGRRKPVLRRVDDDSGQTDEGHRPREGVRQTQEPLERPARGSNLGRVRHGHGYICGEV